MVPEKFFNIILFRHVIEHLHNGDTVLRELCGKLKEGGIIYIEFPSAHSRYLPSMKGTLNFYDDPSHIRLFTIGQIQGVLGVNGCHIVRSGVRRSLKWVILWPFSAIKFLFTEGRIPAGVFWDITGFASYVIARKDF